MRRVAPLVVLVSVAWVFGPTPARAGSGFYLSSELGANFAPELDFLGDSSDGGSVCDPFINPAFPIFPAAPAPAPVGRVCSTVPKAFWPARRWAIGCGIVIPTDCGAASGSNWSNSTGSRHMTGRPRFSAARAWPETSSATKLHGPRNASAASRLTTCLAMCISTF